MRQVLIVGHDTALSDLWAAHLLRMACAVHRAHSASEAMEALRDETIDVIVLDLELPEGCAMTVADYAAICQPRARILFVTASSFFSDGSIFRHCSNACGIVASSTAPEDIAAMVDHFAQRV